jgi:hypothetical protein
MIDMKLVKVAGLAAVLALAGVAAIVIWGGGSASAEEEAGDPEIVLCKTTMQLCTPESEVWPGGKTVTALTTGAVKFLAVHGVECEGGLIKGEVVEKMETELSYRITEREFKECGREECPALTVRYETLTSAKFKVAKGDAYSLALSSPDIVIECGKEVCRYIPEVAAPLPISNPTNTGFPLVEAKEVKLKLVEGPESCENTVKWDATYKLIGGALTVKLSLFKL